jgi:DNA-binding MarR family transcriptional regulator
MTRDDPANDAAPQDLSCALVAIRDERRHFFEASLFSDPAWDMLLELHCSTVKGETRSVSSLSIVAGCPHSTGLRWLALLEDRGLVQRSGHPTDGRSYLVQLTPSAQSSMSQYLERIGSTQLNKVSTGAEQ